MKNKEKTQKINIQNTPIKVINSLINSKKDKNNQDLLFNESSHYLNNEKIVSKYNNTISFINSENNKNILDNQIKKNNVIINVATNKEVSSKDKFIQTPPYFYSIDNIQKIKNNCKTPNNRHINDLNKYLINQRDINIKIIPRINSYIRKVNFSKTFYNQYGRIKNIKYSRNKLFPIIKNNKQKTTGFENSFKDCNVLKEYYNSSKEKKKKHHNLLTIENIYLQKRRHSNNNYKINYDSKKDENNNINIYLLKKKYSIKEIKYPLYNNISKKYRVINDSNAHLLEKIFKRQTLSNFNNKYTVKYKTNNSVKKENIKNLFSLLKKYKYSDKDKQTVFKKYNSMKKIKKNKQ